MQKITTAHSQPLFNVAAIRRIEQTTASALPAHTLMQRAGLAVARLAMALAPHARCIWVACGPGNNGGDGFEAAVHLHQWGKHVVVTWTGAGKNGLPPDAAAAHQKAVDAGVIFVDTPPPDFDFCIDALLGIGGTLDPAREGTARMLQWLDAMATSTGRCLAVDVPSGLNADTGASTVINSAIHSGAARAYIYRARARFTLSLLTLKPGLFTFQGRDSAGEVWFDDLGVDVSDELPSAWLLGADRVIAPHRLESSHKGSFGDVAVIGGESTNNSHMAGAALLSASAALHAGAGRVFVGLLGDAAVTVDPCQPELMFRSPEALDLRTQTVVCGCGGGQSIKAVLPKVLSTATRLVLDADALNAISNDISLQTLLKARSARGYATVLTPHPLEAARLLQNTTAQVQCDRLKAAAQLAERYQAVVVLKGSGSLVAASSQTSRINSSGNALLATAGTGDVLAGMVGAALARGLNAFDAACSAVFRHGQVADDWEHTYPGEALTASRLAAAI
ncbi:MAG: NAD(P)H-hydrate dehydratase [Vitreoscilla sp.]|nr:NAD(P)H-hydrate dehydratase [Polaromonas sp.]